MKKIYVLTLITVLLFISSIKSQCTFGNFPPTYTLNPGWTNGIWLAKKYTLATTATLTGLGLNALFNSGTPYRMAIYTDASNVPGNFITATSQGTMGLGQNVLNLSSTTVLPAGDYWITAIFNMSGTPVGALPSATPALYILGSLSTPPASMSTWTNTTYYDLDYWAVINTPSVVVAGPSTVCVGSSITLTASGATTYTWVTTANTPTVALAPTLNTTYFVSATGANGCTATAVTSITVFALPTLSISGDATVCAGSAISLTATGAASYAWSTGALTNTLINTPSGNTTYTVGGIDLNGCTASTVHAVTLISPTLTIAGNSTVCAGSAISLTATGVASYIWDTGDLTNTLVSTPLVNTSYSVVGVDLNGCPAMAVHSVALISPTLTIAGNSTVCAGSAISLTATGVASYTWNTGALTNTIVNTPSVNISYSVAGLDLNGCAASAIHSVTLLSPTLSIAGNTVLCSGAVASLSLSGASTYSWSTGATTSTINLAPMMGMSYTATGFDANNCKDSKVVSIVVNTVPALTYAFSNSVLCAGETGTISVTGASNFSWNTGAVTPYLIVSPVVNTDYTVTGANTHGCLTSVSITQSVTVCDGIQTTDVRSFIVNCVSKSW